MRSREVGVNDDQPRSGVSQTDRNAVGRGIGVEGEPGRTGLRNRDLRDEQVEATLHPETRHLASPEPLRDEAARHRVGASVDLGIGQPAVRRPKSRRVGRRRHRAGEDLAQQFIAQEIRTFGALQACRYPGGWFDKGVVIAGLAFHRGLAHSIKRPCSPHDLSQMAWHTEHCNSLRRVCRATMW